MQALFIIWLGLFHPFYVSVTEIKHNPKTQAVEVSCRMFYDDLEHALEKDNKTPLDIVKPADKAQLNRFISEYVKKHLSIKADGKVLNLNYVGYEIQEDGAWVYFEVKGVSTVKKIDIHDELLNAMHAEQINMLHVTVGGQRKSTKLDAPDADTSFSF
ncbi:DUF6702 family protein [Mucilaginibacter phyllosphaerae]|uniref:Uncharacterized protein n=2 Tax=Mucilaginibacter phyllosphaerae TaxID=1812349 RepID=A0ABR6I380_9SPHI|nr:DUF6702 family protein [Mucilaginibacter phyllosphaerae]MBB3967496.1 hypothetical protein [Mucilaginibacter phyllosphaerae]GGH21043.1 hypothetical protein GCM10007352_33470 [Mucilaginibacter phyllosphaerae]